MSRKNWCKHYNGTVNTTCKAGVVYTDVEKGRGTKQFSLPCFKEGEPMGNQLGAVCEKCEFRTLEEIAEMEAAMSKRWEDVFKARVAIVEACGGPWKKGMGGKQGVITCPVCEKPDSLGFSRAGYNGHIHAKCFTNGCVSWME